MKKWSIGILIVCAVFVSCNKDDDKETSETPEATIVTYKDVALKLDGSSSNEYGMAFSAANGKTYKSSELSTNIAAIDFVTATNQVFIAFDSPMENDDTKTINGARTTKIQLSNVSMTPTEFDAMEDSSKLKSLQITHDKESQPITYRGVVLFETQDGKKGAIKITAVNGSRVLFDVKVMK
ncbi:MAG: hypothetical protein OIF50_09010 [Flavobacteriaceae bacterium]|nr:hypothetical protein [Flavobacteriaceae bacterium]